MMAASLRGRALRSVQRFLTYGDRYPYAMRDTVYRALCTAVRWRTGRPDLDTPRREVLEALETDGIASHLRDLSAQELSALTLALGPIRPIVFDYGAGRRDKAVFESKDLAATHPFLALATDDEIVRIVATYLGGPPVIQALTVWDIDAESAEQTEMDYHLDYHGLRSLKLFFYLGDVAEGGGHHEYIAGSHRRGKYQRPAVRVIGPAGTSFIEDTRGLHRGTPVVDGTRRRVFKVLYTAVFSEKDRVEKSRDASAYRARLAETRLDPRVFRRLCAEVIELPPA